MDDRKKYLGGSDAAPCLGLSKWISPLQLWAEKTGQVPLPEVDSEAANLGRELEDYVARRFMKKTGKKVRRNNRTIYHKNYPFLGANLDREIVGEDAILECKTCSAWKLKEWANEEVPLDYIIQAYHYLAVSGAKKGYIACLIGNQKFVWKEIERDEKVIADLIKKETYFWQEFVVKRQMPLQITNRDSDVLYQLYPTATEEVIPLDDNALKIIESIQSLKQDAMSIKAIMEKQENELKAILKENQAGEVGNFRITWKEQVQKRLNLDALKNEQQEIYSRYLKEIKSRVFRINKKEEQNG